MKTIQVAAMLSLSVGSMAFGQQAVQWKVADGGNGHWYAVDLFPLWWDAWTERAALLGARLASITSFPEQQRVEAVIGPMSNGGYPQLLWLGAVRRNCSWAWTSSEAWDFAYWAQGNPNGGCTDAQLGIFVNQTLPQFNLGWDDCTCPNNGEPTGAVLEWSADCNNDGIVDYGQCRDGSLPDYNGNNIPDCCEQGTPCVFDSYPVQWRESEGGNGHWYRFVPVLTDWQAARAAARSNGADLVSITSAAEGEFLRPLGRTPTAWMGAIQAPGGCEPGCEWQWSDGSAWRYQNWDPQSGEPNDGGCCWPSNEDVGEFRFGNGRWNDYLVSAVIPSLVEWSADCDNDGFVDYGQIASGQLPDANANGVPDGCECASVPGLPACCVGNLNGDTAVDGADLGTLLNAWGPCAASCAADLVRDGFVNGADLGALLGNWGACP